MKLDENKHDHKLTNCLKVGIFTLLMLAPMFASISQTLYVTFNKNAYQSYSQQVNYKYESNAVDEVTDLIRGHIYKFTLNSFPSATDRVFNILACYNMNTLVNYNIDTESSDDYVVLELRTNGIQLRSNTFVAIAGVNLTENDLPYTIDIVYRDNLSALPSESYYKIEKTDFNILTSNTKNAYLDNAFYYGVDQMTKSDLFNWTQNTALYTGINAMTTQLEIQTPAIAILLTYWFILTIIYVIIDIVLKGFTLLTHMFSNKV